MSRIRHEKTNVETGNRVSNFFRGITAQVKSMILDYKLKELVISNHPELLKLVRGPDGSELLLRIARMVNGNNILYADRAINFLVLAITNRVDIKSALPELQNAAECNPDADIRGKARQAIITGSQLQLKFSKST